MSMYVQVTYLCFDCLASAFCLLPRWLLCLLQQTDSLAETCADKRKSKQNEHHREAAVSVMSWHHVLQSVFEF